MFAWVLLAVSIGIAVVATFYLMARASKGYDKARARREGAAPVRVCSSCRSRMDYSGIREWRVEQGAPTGREDQSETMIVETYTCPTCRKVEFFLPPAAFE